MCGIIGKISESIDQNIIDCINCISHRGPDDQGYVRIESSGKLIELGHTRLSILDLSSRGSQPMVSRDKRWVIAYNGEIYNHKELRQEINVSFMGDSDTETLVEAISQWGIEKTLNKINGMYAFVVFDTKCNRIHLVRDPFGIKPLYYLSDNNTFIFSSEIRGIKAINESLFPVDTKSLQTFLTLRYIPSPYTLFKGIKRLPPGHILCFHIDTGKIELSFFPKYTADSFSGSMGDAVDEYTLKLKEAVKRQLLSDVPVGVLLSGGIDSSLIAAMAAETGINIPCFTVGFGNAYNDCEIEDAAQTARILGLKHRAVEVNPDSLWDVFADVIRFVEEPLGTTSILPMWYLVKKAKEDVTVVLTGQGSDEPWGGYRRYQAEILRKYFPFTSLYKAGHNIFTRIRFLPDFAERGLRSLGKSSMPGRFEEAYVLFTFKERKSLTGNPDDGRALDSIKGWLDLINAPNLPSVEQMMRIDTRMNLSDDLLLYGDKISMAVSLEARVPMLDIELVKFVESLPVKYKVSLNRTKIVHKLAAKRYLPENIVNRPKKGFQVPFAQWAGGIWKEKIESVLFEKNATYLSAVDIKGVQKIWAEHCSGKRNRARQLFALLTLAFCLKQSSG